MALGFPELMPTFQQLIYFIFSENGCGLIFRLPADERSHLVTSGPPGLYRINGFMLFVLENLGYTLKKGFRESELKAM